MISHDWDAGGLHLYNPVQSKITSTMDLGLPPTVSQFLLVRQKNEI